MAKLDYSDLQAGLQSSVNKELIDTIGMQLEACREAAEFTVQMAYLTFAEGVYLSEHGHWVDLSMRPGDNEDLFRNKVHARLRMERNTIASLQTVIDDYTDSGTAQDIAHPSCAFTLGVSKLGSTARLIRREFIPKGVLVTLPDTMTVSEIKSLLDDLGTVKEAACRLFIYVDGKGIVFSTGGLAESIASRSTPVTIPGNPDSSSYPTTSGFPIPNTDYVLYPQVVDPTGTIIGSTVNRTTSPFGIGVDYSDINPPKET